MFSDEHFYHEKSISVFLLTIFLSNSVWFHFLFNFFCSVSLSPYSGQENLSCALLPLFAGNNQAFTSTLTNRDHSLFALNLLWCYQFLIHRAAVMLLQRLIFREQTEERIKTQDPIQFVLNGNYRGQRVILLRNSWGTNLTLMLRASYLILWCMKFFNVGQQSCIIIEISAGGEQEWWWFDGSLTCHTAWRSDHFKIDL